MTAEINGYLMAQIKKLETENQGLRARLAKLEAYLQSWRSDMTERFEECEAYFELMEE